MPVLSGLIFLICIIIFNQSSIFYSTRATKRYWYVLAPTLLYVIVGGINQMVMLYLIRNYSVRASNRNSQNLNQSQVKHNSPDADIDSHIERLLNEYRET